VAEIDSSVTPPPVDLYQLCVHPAAWDSIKKLIEGRYPHLRVVRMPDSAQEAPEIETYMIAPAPDKNCQICGLPRASNHNKFGTHQCPPPGH
jgi:hypothetical protein